METQPKNPILNIGAMMIELGVIAYWLRDRVEVFTFLISNCVSLTSSIAHLPSYSLRR